MNESGKTGLFRTEMMTANIKKAWKSNNLEEIKMIRDTEPTTGHGHHHGQTVAPSILVAHLCSTYCFSWISLDRGSGHDLSMLGVFVPISLSSMIH